MWWPVFPCDTWYQSQQNTIRLSDSAHILDKYDFPKVFEIFSPRVSTFLLESQVCQKRGYQQIFVAGFSKLFATTWAEIAENEEILHKPKVVQNSFLIPFHEGHAFQIWMFLKYVLDPSLPNGKLMRDVCVKRQFWFSCKRFVWNAVIMITNSDEKWAQLALEPCM